MEKKSKIKILCVDDERDNLDTIKDSLDGLDYLIECETNPKKALKKIMSDHFDIVITDLMMPDVTGIEIVNAVKSTGRDTLVIVVTGFASIDTAIKSVQYGVYDYLQKPFTNIPNTIKRAVEKLELQRKNHELGKKIEETLSKVSLLHDISSILYQVSDFNESSEMILDTIAEGFKLNKIGIIIKNKDKSIFEVYKYRKINPSFEKFYFASDDKINDNNISTAETTRINGIDGDLKTSKIKVLLDKSVDSMVLVPINFHINTLGYIAVFTNGDFKMDLDNGNVIELLEIFSNQVAPILHSFLNTENNKSCSEKYISDIIESRLIDAKSILSPISFALVRLVLLNTPKEISLVDDYLSSSKNIISKDINGLGEIYWQNKDTGLIVFPAADLFMIEKFCIELLEKIEGLKLTGNKNKVITLKYSCINYPQSGNSPAVLANMLWKNLFEELEKRDEVINA